MGIKSKRAKAIARLEKRQAEAEALASRPKKYGFADKISQLTPKEIERFIKSGGKITFVQRKFDWLDTPYFGPYGESQ